MVTKKTGKTARHREQNPSASPAPDSFRIIGIGASAGGLQAFEEFFSTMPEESGFAFVLVAHLDPTHVSILPDLIQKKTGMKVAQVVDNVKILPNHIYIIPPNRDLALLHGTLQLFEQKKRRGTNMPIDSFFASLATDLRHQAIGIILSGTGTDGTGGIQAIKKEKGLVIVQDPATAKYDGMPRNAIATGQVDYILAPDRMPDLLSELAVKWTGDEGVMSRFGKERMTSALQKIFVLLRTATEHDFSMYKSNTIFRRLERRMNINQIEDIDDYVSFLQESDKEAKVLFKELLIGVTSFFRDPAPFELLKEKYLPELLQDKPYNYQVRIWVPGCSSGEEAYSIAIILHECMEATGRSFPVQIFGTDLDEESINVARVGRYPHSIADQLTPERLKKYFSRDDHHFTVTKAIREMLVFAPQNIIKDPPFTHIDLVCCRNLLIYFNATLQDKLLPIFHYSLRPGGLLFLGSSETIGHKSDLFVIIDKKWKIFKKMNMESRHPEMKFPITDQSLEAREKEVVRPADQPRSIQMLRLLKTVLFHSELPPCVIIDSAANIIYIHGRTGRYLEPAEGEITANVVEMARPGLRAGLISALRRINGERDPAEVKKRMRIEEGEDRFMLDLVVRPLPSGQTGQQGLIMVVFQEIAELTTIKDSEAAAGAEKSDEVKRLEDDLLYTREDLQSTIEELGTSNEELRSTNEELQAANEELQSTNEELETSKEELQSLNEESITVNAELQSRIEELIIANDDIKNLLDATDIATIFLDINLNVRRFTPKATQLFHLTPADVGRPLAHFATTLKDVKLTEQAGEVLKNLGQSESEVEDQGGDLYRMRVRPYRTLNNVIAGVVVTFENMSYYKELAGNLRECESLWRRLMEHAPVGAFITVDGRFASLNSSAQQLFGIASEEELVGKTVVDRVHRDSAEEVKVVMNDRRPVAALDGKWLRLDGRVVEATWSAAPISFKKQDGVLMFVQEKPQSS